MNGGGYPKGLVGSEIGVYGRMAAIVDCFAALTNHRPYAAASSSYEALRSLSGWSGEYFHEPLVQQFVSSVGVFPVGSLIELSTGEVAVVVEHSKVRRLKPRVLVITGPDKTPSSQFRFGIEPRAIAVETNRSRLGPIAIEQGAPSDRNRGTGNRPWARHHR